MAGLKRETSLVGRLLDFSKYWETLMASRRIQAVFRRNIHSAPPEASLSLSRRRRAQLTRLTSLRPTTTHPLAALLHWPSTGGARRFSAIFLTRIMATPSIRLPRLPLPLPRLWLSILADLMELFSWTTSALI